MDSDTEDEIEESEMQKCIEAEDEIDDDLEINRRGGRNATTIKKTRSLTEAFKSMNYVRRSTSVDSESHRSNTSQTSLRESRKR